MLDRGGGHLAPVRAIAFRVGGPRAGVPARLARLSRRPGRGRTIARMAQKTTLGELFDPTKPLGAILAGVAATLLVRAIVKAAGGRL